MRKFEEIDFSEGTPDKLKRVLYDAYVAQSSVRLFYGDPKTGRDWLERSSVKGFRIGCSTGEKPCLILLERKNSICGGALLTANIVRFLLNGKEAYRHPMYFLPPMEIRNNGIYVDNAIYWKGSRDQCDKVVAFLKGERNRLW